MDQTDQTLKDNWTVVDGIPIYARLAIPPHQAPPPIVLVHGFGISSRYMVPIANCLASDYAVYAPDLPGFGNSGKPASALTVRQLADSLAKWMGAMGIDRALLLGNSFGCQIIVELALHYPERVAGLVLVGPTSDPEARTFLEQSVRLLRDARHERKSLWPLHLLDDWKAGIGRLWQTGRYALADRIEEKLSSIPMPTLVVRGGGDLVISQAWAERVARLLPEGQLVTIPDAPHALNYSAPHRLAAVVRAFLAEKLLSLPEPSSR